MGFGIWQGCTRPVDLQALSPAAANRQGCQDLQSVCKDLLQKPRLAVSATRHSAIKCRCSTKCCGNPPLSKSVPCGDVLTTI